MKKKSLLVVLLIMLACTCFVACGSSYEKPSNPVLSATYNSITVEEPKDVNLYGYEYSKDDKTWQTNKVFSDLQSNTEYTIFMRRSADDSSKASPSSSSKITTLKLEKEVPLAITYTQNEKLFEFTTTDESLEYSFDGITYSSTKSHIYTEKGENKVYARYKETDTHQASTPYEIKINISSFASGFGTAEEPYIIKTKEQFSFTGTRFENYYYYKLENDLDFGNQVIETSFGNVYGEFDGNGHTVKNAIINYSGDKEIIYVGLFSNVKDIKDLKAENIKITGNCGIGRSPFVYFGLIAGSVYASATNCSVSGTIDLNFMDGEATGVYMGGFVGKSLGQVANCFADADISVSTNGSIGENDFWCIGNLYVGGFAGSAEKIFKSNAVGSIEIKSTKRFYYVNVGGILGTLVNTMENCYSSTAITVATNTIDVYAGGLVGLIEYKDVAQKIFNSYSESNIGILNEMRDSYAGGILGYLSKDKIVIENVFFAGNITNSTSGSNPYDKPYEAVNSDMIGHSSSFNGTPYTYEIKNCYYSTSSHFDAPVIDYLGISAASSSFETKSWLETNLKWDAEIWEIKDGALPVLKQA